MRLIVAIFSCFLFCCSHQNDNSVSDKQHKMRFLKEPKIAFNPKQYVCYKTDELIVVDGNMNEISWQEAEWTEDFVDIEGDSKPIPRFRTRVKMLWDNKYFYVFADMEEPHVWAKLKKRDSVIFYDNDFEVFIDPNGDTHRYYELEINAFGTEWDLFLDKPYRDDCRPMSFWDIAGLKSKVDVNGTINQPNDVDKGWTVEIAIPWIVLKECADKKSPPRNGDQWRINFSRVEWQVEVIDGKYKKVKDPTTKNPLPEDNWVWSPQGLINMHYPEMWGFVQFSEISVGTGEEVFYYQKEEDAKWALRTLYYKQRNFFIQNGVYTNKIEDLNLPNYKIDSYSWSPVIKYTDSFFEAVLSDKNNNHRWHISQDGKIWKQ